jgi:hypothetical protein
MIGAATVVSSDETPLRPMARSALRIWTRVFVVGGHFLDGLGALGHQLLVVKLRAIQAAYAAAKAARG